MSTQTPATYTLPSCPAPMDPSIELKTLDPALRYTFGKARDLSAPWKLQVATSAFSLWQPS
jgi:hypothetical protein